MDWYELFELNLTEICRCCKRAESGMTRIFDGNAHPPVNEMLSCIASLNIQENDGLPLLVCTVCLNKIQDAYTFHLQLIEIDAQLRQIIATRKQADALTQASQNANGVDVEAVEAVDEMIHSIKVEEVEDLDEPIQNEHDHDHHGSADNSNENIDLVVKPEVVPVPEIEEANKLESQWEENVICVKLESPITISGEVIQFSCQQKHSESPDQDLDLEKIIVMNKSNTYTTNEDLSVNDVDDFVIVQKVEDMEEFEDIEVDIMGVEAVEGDASEVEIEEICSNRTKRRNRDVEDAEDTEVDIMEEEYYQDDNEDKEIDKICPNMRTKRRRKTKEIEDMEDFEYIDDSEADEDYKEDVDGDSIDSSDSEYIPQVSSKARKNSVVKTKRNANKHHGDVDHVEYRDDEEPTPFTCLVCNEIFEDISLLEAHGKERHKNCHVMQYRKCSTIYSRIYALNEQMRKHHQRKKHQRTKDCVKDAQEEQETTSKGFPMFKCKLCGFSCGRRDNLKDHLQTTHSNIRPFACSKCKYTFKQRGALVQHWRNCNGQKRKYVRKEKVSQEIVCLTRQDLEDIEEPVKMRKFYTVTRSDEGLKEQTVEDGGDDEGDEGDEDEEISPRWQTHPPESTLKLLVFSCELCSYTSSHLSHVKRHLFTHSKDKKLFECSKCNFTFTRRANMLQHGRNCNGELSKKALGARLKENASNVVLSLTRQDLEDSVKMKQYYRVTEIKVQNKDDVEGDVKVQKSKHPGDDVDLDLDLDVEEISSEFRTPRKMTVIKCTLCSFTTARMDCLKQHLHSHSKEKRFTCSKCSGTFTQRCSLRRHWRICTGKINKYTRQKGKAPEEVTLLTSQDLDLKDPEKLKKYYTVTEIEL